VYAAISSLSLSLLATGIDSIFDIGSNVLLFWLHKKASRLDVNKWPVGGARLETIGNIVYGALSSIKQTSSQLMNASRFPVSVTNTFACWISSHLLASMGSVNLVVIVESVQTLITSNGELRDFHIPSIVAVAAALGRVHVLSARLASDVT
jgi:divalent metal cation (Fe/Co/Zn/Cd) transporter